MTESDRLSTTGRCAIDGQSAYDWSEDERTSDDESVGYSNDDIGDEFRFEYTDAPKIDIPSAQRSCIVKMYGLAAVSVRSVVTEA